VLLLVCCVATWAEDLPLEKIYRFVKSVMCCMSDRWTSLLVSGDICLLD
jgi:hypothetical protein